MSDVRDHVISLNGLRFHYREWGDASAPPLVLLHGFSSQCRTWDEFAADMADPRRVLALDLRGHGESEWASSYAPQDWIDDLAAFADALGLERFALVGHSLGGRIAYAYAASHPERIERLVIVDIGPQVGASGLSRINSQVTQPRDVFGSPDEVVAMMRAANPRPPDHRLWQRTVNNLMPTDDGRWTWRYDPALRRRPLERPAVDQGWEQLAAIPAPTLIVRGADSDILSDETARRMVEVMLDARSVEIPDAGHSVSLDNYDAFLAALRPFLVP